MTIQEIYTENLPVIDGVVIYHAVVVKSAEAAETSRRNAARKCYGDGCFVRVVEFQCFGEWRVEVCGPEFAGDLWAARDGLFDRSLPQPTLVGAELKIRYYGECGVYHDV